MLGREGDNVPRKTINKSPFTYITSQRNSSESLVLGVRTRMRNEGSNGKEYEMRAHCLR